jgi:two-component system NtrC family sensor kinase
MKHRFASKKFWSLRQKSPLYFLIMMVLLVFCAETFIMLLFLILPKMPDLVETLVDSTLLSILIAPGLYFSLYRPLVEEIKQRSRTEAELQEAKTYLEEQNQQLVEALQKLQQTPQLVQTEKMSSLSRLVSGIAHEINNPVSFIHGNLIHNREYTQRLLNLLNLYQHHYPHPHPEIVDLIENSDFNYVIEDLPKVLSSMQTGAERIRQIVLSLRNFSRLNEAEIKEVDIHHGIDSTLLLLQHRLQPTAKYSGIKVIRDYGKLPLIQCYAGQMNQVFINILNNAIDTLEELELHSNIITIKTQQINPTWVQIRICDNGLGIPEPLQNQIFDAFFTTKTIGKGTGLGLSICYQIVVEKHQGHLYCISEPGKGTEFVIEIPIELVR